MEWGALFVVTIFRQVNEELGCRDEKNSNGKLGRKYQGEVIKLKGFSTFMQCKVKLKSIYIR
jgi:hypothetical protein